MNRRPYFVGFAVVVLPLVALAGTSCSSGQTQSPIAPGSPPAGPGTVEVAGVVRGERPPTTRIGTPAPAEPGVAVSVVAGAATGRSTVTTAQGVYALQLPEGLFRLSFSKAGFQIQEIADQSVAAGNHFEMPDVVLKTAPWAITGTVRDSAGNHVAGANVTIDIGDAFARTLSTISGDDGRYRIASTVPHFDAVYVSASRTGFEGLFPRQQVACCAPPADAVYDIRLVRVLRVAMIAPSLLRVGEGVELPAATIDLDDGIQRFVYILPASSDPTVVAVERGQRGFVIRGMRPGQAMVTFDYQGVDATQAVQVVSETALSTSGRHQPSS
jgi:carboxypeptidase family protein